MEVSDSDKARGLQQWGCRERGLVGGCIVVVSLVALSMASHCPC